MIQVAFTEQRPEWVRWDQDEVQWLNSVTNNFFSARDLRSGRDYRIDEGFVAFHDKALAMLFKLTWGGV